MPETENLILFFCFWVLALAGFLMALFYIFKEGTGSKKLNWLLPITLILGIVAAVIGFN